MTLHLRRLQSHSASYQEHGRRLENYREWNQSERNGQSCGSIRRDKLLSGNSTGLPSLSSNNYSLLYSSCLILKSHSWYYSMLIMHVYWLSLTPHYTSIYIMTELTVKSMETANMLQKLDLKALEYNGT